MGSSFLSSLGRTRCPTPQASLARIPLVSRCLEGRCSPDALVADLAPWCWAACHTAYTQDKSQDEHVLVVLLQAAKKRADSGANPDREKVVGQFKTFMLRGCLGHNGLGIRVMRGYRCIIEVTPGSPAEIAGLRVGDCIVSVDGKMPGPDQSIGSIIDTYQDEHIVVVQEGDSRSKERMRTFAVTVPAGIGPGQQFRASLDGTIALVTVPFDAVEGSKLHVQMVSTTIEKSEMGNPDKVLAHQKGDAASSHAAVSRQTQRALKFFPPYCD